MPHSKRKTKRRINRKKGSKRKSRCPKGMIIRSSHKRRLPPSHPSKKGSRSKKRSAKYVKVKYACVPDKGKPGKTPAHKRILPPVGDEIRLSRYNYSIHQTQKERRESLNKAIRKFDILPVLRHLNLIRNYQSEERNKDKMTKDVEYLKKLYKKSKRN